MKLNVPEPERVLLTRWLTTNDEPTDAVLDALDAATATLRPSALVQKVADVTKVPLDKADELLFALYNLSRTVARLSEEEKADASAILFRSIVGDVAGADARQLFERRVARVLACKSVQITGKALLVLHDNPNTFCAARTLSELRPVFGEDGLVPQAAVVLHQLKLVYHTGPKRKRSEIFISMDRTAIQQLQQVLRRALEKDEKLSEATSKLGVQLLEGD